MAFDRKWLFVIFIVLVIILILFLGIDKTVKAVTVSNNSIKEKDYADFSDNSSAVSDDTEINNSSNSSDQVDKLDSEVQNEDFSEADRDVGQALYMDSEFTDSLVDYLNFSYKVDLLQLILLALLFGSVLALGVVEWFTK